MGTYIGVFLFFAIPTAVVFYLIRFGFKHLYEITINDDGLVLMIFLRFPVARINFDSIEKAYTPGEFLREHSLLTSMFCVIPLPNRVFISPIILELKRK